MRCPQDCWGNKKAPRRPQVSAWPHLERGAGCVVHIGQDLHWLLEHDTEGAGGAVAAETRVILAKDCVAVRVDDLGAEGWLLSCLGKQGLQGGTGEGRRLGMVSRRLGVVGAWPEGLRDQGRK